MIPMIAAAASRWPVTSRIAATALSLQLLAAGAAAQHASDHRPVVSPDGTTLAFMSDRSGVWAIYLMDLGDHQVRRVSADPRGEWYADWSHDGTRLVYHRAYTEAGARQIFVYDVEAEREIALTPPSGDRSYARWMPDDEALLFSAAGAGEGRIHRIGVRGDGETSLLDLAGRQHDATPSPDGARVAMIRESGDGDGIFLVRLDGGGLRRLVAHPASVYGIDWSPDGRFIAYNTDVDGDHELRVVNVATGVTRQVTFNEWTDHLPRWLSDGETLIFSAERDDAERIYTIRQDGTDLREVDTGHRR